jgi:two-component system CheB/CheR fusion protein
MPVQTMIDMLGLTSGHELLGLLLHTVQDYALIILDPAGQIVSWGRGAEQIFGYQRDEVLGRSFTILYTPEDQVRGRPQQELATAIREGCADDTNWLVRKDGGLLWASGSSTPLQTADGVLHGFVKIVRDASAQHQAEAERQRMFDEVQAARALAEEALATRDQFLSVISHELKTPITTILAHAQLLAHRLTRGQVFGERELRSLDLIAEQTHRLTRMLDLMLDVGRLQRGTFTVRRMPLNLAALLRQVVDRVQQPLDQHTLVLDCPPTALLLHGDPERLEQVFENLLQNAVKYSPAGGQVTVTVTPAANQVCVAIQDTGIGIPAEDQVHLFERFYRAPNAKRHQIKGSGIGLYVVHELVTLHGGTITVDSAEGQGSTFTVCLPREATPATDAAPLAES